MAAPKRKPFPSKSSTPKSQRGSTAASQTPLHVRARGVDLSDKKEERMRARIGRQLGKYAHDIERVTARLEDVNGPRGGVDVKCKLKVVLSGRQSVVVEETAEDAWSAFMAASDAVARSVKRSVERTGSRGRRHAADASKTGKKRSPKRRAAPAAAADGSLIGRRVGRSAANLQRAAARPEKERRDVPVDTSAPGRSATDRRVGATATATRNTKLNRSGMTAALEDSASGKPSRKSTRRSGERVKQSSQLERRQGRRVRSPEARATRARAASKGVRGKSRA